MEQRFQKEQEADSQLNNMTSMGLSTAPVVGDIKDAQEMVLGKDLVTGERLSTFERGISLVAIFIPLVSGRMVDSSAMQK